MRSRTRTRILMSSAALLCLSGLAFAQEAAPAPDADEAGEEVVVTAQKREQRLQDVPLSVTAFTAQTLENQATQSLTDLNAKSPNVVLAPVGAYPYASAFYMRGLGFADVESSFEPSVGVEMNGVYLARNSGALQDFFDIGSVEILRGPQGTLYGRNTIGGVVAVRTKRPDGTFSGEAMGTIGDHGRREARLAMNFPISADLAGRVSLLYKNYDGYTWNATRGVTEGDNETLAGRLTLAYTPSDKFDATLILDINQERGSGASFRNAALPGNVYAGPGFSTTTGDPRVVYGGAPIFADLDTWGGALEMNYDFGNSTLTSITGYRAFKDRVFSDYDASAITFFQALRDQTHWQFSEELRLASNGDGPLNYVFGVFYLTQNYDISNAQSGLIYGGGTLTQFANQDNTAYAVFGQLDYNVTDKLILTAGGRYSYEKKTFTNDPLGPVGPSTFEDSWSDFSPKLGVSYAFNDNILAYAQWQQGFRSGGYNGRAATVTSVGPYDAEKVNAYEIGLKTTLADGKLRLNFAAFSNEYSDMQQGVQGFTSGGLYETLIVNAASARIDGFEVEANWVVGGGFTLNASLGYLDARFDEYFADLTSDGVANPTDNSDLPLPYAPKWSGAFGLTYAHDFDFGSVTFNTNVVYMDDIYTSGGTLNRISDVQVREANTLLDATLSLETLDEKWRVTLWGKNLTDELVINNTFGLGALGNLRIYAPPRTWGLDIAVRF